MNQAQKNDLIVNAALETPEGQAAMLAVSEKVKTWFPDGGWEPWPDEVFKRLWLMFDKRGNVGGFWNELHSVMYARFRGWNGRAELQLGHRQGADRTDDEFYELIEDWERAVRMVTNPEEFEDKRSFISDWILERISAGVIDWHCRDKSYWHRILCDVNEETRMPPKEHGRTARTRARRWDRFSSLLVESADFYALPGGWYSVIPKSPSDWVRRARYIFRAAKDQIRSKRGQNPVADYGKDVGEELIAQLDRIEREIGDPCQDNFRFADARSAGDMKRYKRRVRSGCCGSHDTTVVIKGRKFWIGLNYGH